MLPIKLLPNADYARTYTAYEDYDYVLTVSHCYRYKLPLLPGSRCQANARISVSSRFPASYYPATYDVYNYVLTVGHCYHTANARILVSICLPTSYYLAPATHGGL